MVLGAMLRQTGVEIENLIVAIAIAELYCCVGIDVGFFKSHLSVILNVLMCQFACSLI